MVVIFCCGVAHEGDVTALKIQIKHALQPLLL
jgi:hypothetical protein